MCWAHSAITTWRGGCDCMSVRYVRVLIVSVWNVYGGCTGVLLLMLLHTAHIRCRCCEAKRSALLWQCWLHIQAAGATRIGHYRPTTELEHCSMHFTRTAHGLSVCYERQINNREMNKVDGHNSNYLFKWIYYGTKWTINEYMLLRPCSPLDVRIYCITKRVAECGTLVESDSWNVECQPPTAWHDKKDANETMRCLRSGDSHFSLSLSVSLSLNFIRSSGPKRCGLPFHEIKMASFHVNIIHENVRTKIFFSHRPTTRFNGQMNLFSGMGQDTSRKKTQYFWLKAPRKTVLY